MPGPNSPYTKLDQNHILQRSFDETADRLRVDANVTASIGAVECIIDAATGDNIKISDGTDTLLINPDGSLNVTVLNTTVPEINFIYDEVLNVANGITTDIITFVPLVNSKIVEISVSGTNVATYELLKNNVVIEKKRTYFGTELDVIFTLHGLVLNSGQELKLAVTHNRPDPGDFNATLKYTE